MDVDTINVAEIRGHELFWGPETCTEDKFCGKYTAGIVAPLFETMKTWFNIMCYEISVPLNTSYWDKPWQAHVVTEVDGTLQEEREEEERNGERKEMGKEREGKGEGSRGRGEEDGKGRERRARYSQLSLNGRSE